MDDGVSELQVVYVFVHICTCVCMQDSNALRVMARARDH